MIHGASMKSLNSQHWYTCQFKQIKQLPLKCNLTIDLPDTLVNNIMTRLMMVERLGLNQFDFYTKLNE